MENDWAFLIDECVDPAVAKWGNFESVEGRYLAWKPRVTAPCCGYPPSPSPGGRGNALVLFRKVILDLMFLGSELLDSGFKPFIENDLT